MVQVLASFPNSRIKPRNATSNADTGQTYINGDGEAPGTIMPDGGIVTANGNIAVLPANPNQTYVFMRNTSLVARLYYSYTDRSNMLTEGNFLEPGEGFDIESKDGIWARSNVAGIPGRTKASLDFGQG